MRVPVPFADRADARYLSAAPRRALPIEVSMLPTLVRAAVLFAVPLAAQAPTVNEPSSNVPFPVYMNAANGAHQILMGTGIRTRTLLKVKVYAFGLYVDSAAARSALGSFAGQAQRDLERSDAFYSAVLRMQFSMTLRLVMTRDVSGERMTEAFDGALRPRVVAAAGRNMPGGEAALEHFRAYFSLDELTNGAELAFTCTPDGMLTSRVAGQQRDPITNPALCWALFDVYLGQDPISGDGKKSIIANFPALLGT